jgi:hypothetical protein
MAKNNFNPSGLEEMWGAASIAACLVASPLLRPWYGKWGATEGEVRMPLPGDDLVPEPVLEAIRAITIQAPAEAIWPWLVQLGQGRGGFYSYQRLENLAGCRIHNADDVIPEFQEIKIGDQVRLGPDGYPAFDVAAIEPERALVLRGDLPNPKGKPTIWIWSFYLAPHGDDTTRLLLRTRLVYEPNMANALIWRAFTDPISFNMERKMLHGLKARAEYNLFTNKDIKEPNDE